eukprot:gb/GEZN01006712.1/.p1 GENE.gb/GEZN01006712.1/~~gb/GEZN01006712.1/.p1  ORF type:complete len:225 (+),score=35.21 gb/GEZN01006712.1/:457-1131(+)
MSGFDYRGLPEEDAAVSVSSARLAGGLVGLALTAAAGAVHLMSGESDLAGAAAFSPKEGMDAIKAKPLPGTLQVVPPLTPGKPECIFTYGSPSGGVTSTAEEGWVYGAALSPGAVTAVATGEAVDVVKGLLTCWPNGDPAFRQALSQQDKLRGFDPENPMKGNVRRDVVDVVKKDGSTQEAYWYTQSPDIAPFFRLSALDIDGNLQSFAQFNGMVSFVINVASK